VNMTRLQQYIKRNPLTVIITIIVILFVARSSFFHKPPQAPTLPLPKVTVMDMTAKPVTTYLQLNGHTAEARRVTLKAKTGGRVHTLLTTKGEHVETGQDLIMLDPEDRPARLAEAKAKFHQRSLEFQANTKLEAKAVKSQNALAASTAEYESAKSSLASIQQEIADTHIKAPFKGIFEETFVEMGDVVNSGDKVATVIELNPLKVLCDISEKDIARIKVGGDSTVTLTSANDRKFNANVVYIAKSADPKTRTYRVELLTDNADMSIPSGLTARINFPTHKTIGYTISPAAMSLRDDGAVGVKAIEHGKVVFYPVQIVETKPDGLLVTGLPDQIALITSGGDFVIEGQDVIATRQSLNMPDNAK
jgi:membrane fusion protein, multidrug efflux system